MKRYIHYLCCLWAIIATSCGILATTSSSNGSKTDILNNIPYYKAQRIYLTDNNGKKILNNDGTPQMRVLLVDQFGRYRSGESVKAQHTAIRKAIGQVLVNIAGGTVIGINEMKAAAKNHGQEASTTDLIIGGFIGGIMGGSLSNDQIAIINRHKESLDEQEKLIEAYSKTFTVEGTPVKADINLSNVDGIDFTKGEPVSMTAEQVKKEIESEGFNSTDTSAWDI